MSNPAIQVPDQASLQSFSASTNTVQQILEEAARLLKLLWRVSLPMKAVHGTVHGTQVLFCSILFEFCFFALLQRVQEDTPVKNMSSGNTVCKSWAWVALFLSSSHHWRPWLNVYCLSVLLSWSYCTAQLFIQQIPYMKVVICSLAVWYSGKLGKLQMFPFSEKRFGLPVIELNSIWLYIFQ